MRASAVVEKAGIPTATLVCEGFSGLGVASLPIARIVGHVDGQSIQELRQNIEETTAAEVIQGLVKTPYTMRTSHSYQEDEIAARGSFSEINAIFEENGWSDGISIVPPTHDLVASFLEQTPDDPDRIIGVLQPSGSAATVRNVAINGIMANCRPEYMPILVAIAEVLCDPEYGVEHSGDTTGGEALIILNGPIIETLKFNCAGAALRDGYRANTSVGRFLRLYLRNVAGIRPDGADKVTFGHTWRVVLAENEREVQNLGWHPFSSDQGFEAGENVVTVGRFTSGGGIGSIFGNNPMEIVRYLADGLVRQTSWELVFTVGFAPGTYRPLLVLSPLVAKTLMSGGMSKEDLQKHLFEHGRMPASKFESYVGLWTNFLPGRPTLRQLVDAGTAASHFAESDDPNRLVPIVEKPEDILLVVSGDPFRSNAYAFASNGMHGFPTSKRIRLPI